MKYHIITYGCQMNTSDSEKIAVLLRARGHKPAKSEKSADIIVLNCCSVRQAAMDRVYDKINKYHKRMLSHKRVIIAGCLLEKDKVALKDKVSEIWHPDSYFECLPTKILNPPRPPLKGGSRGLNYVPIMTGCNNFCSYCAVPYTRGREKSRPAEEIISEVKMLIKNGVKQIMLLGQNVNSYKSSTGYRLPTTARTLTVDSGQWAVANFTKLLKLINSLPGNFKLSFLTSHPKDMSDELIAAMAKCEKLIKELHLPVQSGDDVILRKMNRKYTATHYKNLVKKIRKAIPNIKISTDIIVGFPGETKKQFENTIKLAKTVRFDKAFIAKYSPRVGTAAAKLKDDVPTEEKKRRWRILDTLINKYEH